MLNVNSFRVVLPRDEKKGVQTIERLKVCPFFLSERHLLMQRGTCTVQFHQASNDVRNSIPSKRSPTFSANLHLWD